MPVRYVCKSCGYVLFNFEFVGQDFYGVRTPSEIVGLVGDKCPRCGHKLNTKPSPDDILISINKNKKNSLEVPLPHLNETVTLSFRISNQLYKKSENISNKSEILRKLIYDYIQGKIDVEGKKIETSRAKGQSVIVESKIAKELYEKAKKQGYSVQEILNILYQIMVEMYIKNNDVRQ